MTTALLALCGAQALAPTPAAATVNLTEGSGCRHKSGLPPGVGLDAAGQPCIDLFGGGEVISISGTAPICDPTSVDSCLPQLIGGSGDPRRQAEEETGARREMTPRGNPIRRRARKPAAMTATEDAKGVTCDSIRTSYKDSMNTVARHRARIAYLNEQADRITGSSSNDEEDLKMFAREVKRLEGEQREAREVSELAIEDWNERRCGLQSALTAKRGRPPV